MTPHLHPPIYSSEIKKSSAHIQRRLSFNLTQKTKSQNLSTKEKKLLRNSSLKNPFSELKIPQVPQRQAISLKTRSKCQNQKPENENQKDVNNKSSIFINSSVSGSTSNDFREKLKKSSKKIIRSLSTRNRRGQRGQLEREPEVQNSNSNSHDSMEARNKNSCSKNHNITIKKDITLKKEEKIQIKYKNMKTDDYKNNPSGSNCSENRSLAVIKHLKIPKKNSQKNKNNAKISSTNKSNNKSPKSNSFISDNYDNQNRESEENREHNIKPPKKSKSIEFQHKLLRKLNLSENWKLDDKISNDFEVIESNEDENNENEQLDDDGNRNQKFETFLIELGSVDDLQDQQKLKRVDQVFVDDFYGELKHREQNQLITRKLNSSGSDQLLEGGGEEKAVKRKININHSIEEEETNQYDSIVVHEQQINNNNTTDPTTTQKPDTTLIPPAVNKIIIKKVDNSRKLTDTDKKNNNSNKQIQQIQQIQPQFKINYNFENKNNSNNNFQQHDVQQCDDSTSLVNKKQPVKPSNSFEPFKITEDQTQIISESFICRICEKRIEIESYGANDNKSDSESTNNNNNQNTEFSKTNFICSDCLAHNKNNNIDGRVRRRVKKIEKLEHHRHHNINSDSRIASSSKFIGLGFETF